jgi:hypothetical protein
LLYQYLSYDVAGSGEMLFQPAANISYQNFAPEFVDALYLFKQFFYRLLSAKLWFLQWQFHLWRDEKQARASNVDFLQKYLHRVCLLYLLRNTSAISINPAFMVCTSSPASGTTTTTVVSARPADFYLALPNANRFNNDLIKPAAFIRSAISIIFGCNPPKLPRVASERMNTSG